MIPLLVNHTVMKKRYPVEVAAAAPRPSPTPMAPTPAPTPPERAVASAREEPPVEIPPSLPKAATPSPARASGGSSDGNWVYDANRIVRVQDPRLSLAAAVLTAAREWNLLIDLSVFRNATERQVAGIDMFSLVKQQLHMSNCDLGKDLGATFRFDLPAVMAVSPQSAGDSQFVVASKLDGHTLSVDDPLCGERAVDVRDVASRVEGIRVLYRDDDDLGSLKPGDSGERVKRLQSYLASGRWYEGQPSGTYDQATADALGRLQAFYGIPETRKLDDWTCMLIASRRQPQRPRLSGGS